GRINNRLQGKIQCAGNTTLLGNMNIKTTADTTHCSHQAGLHLAARALAKLPDRHIQQVLANHVLEIHARTVERVPIEVDHAAGGIQQPGKNTRGKIVDHRMQRTDQVGRDRDNVRMISVCMINCHFCTSFPHHWWRLLTDAHIHRPCALLYKYCSLSRHSSNDKRKRQGDIALTSGPSVDRKFYTVLHSTPDCILPGDDDGS